jgi:hypothetical protein
MSIDVVGNRDRGVAELGLDQFGIGAQVDHQGGRRVSQLMDL